LAFLPFAFAVAKKRRSRLPRALFAFLFRVLVLIGYFQTANPNNPETIMRTFITLIAGAMLGIGGLSLAGQDGHGKITVKTIAAQDIAEKVDGKDIKATTVEVTLDPGQSSPPHRHPGPVFGFILEGEYEWGINDQPVKKMKPGDTFYEPAMSLHRVSRNPSDKTKTRVLAVLLLPRDAKQISIPEPMKK